MNQPVPPPDPAAQAVVARVHREVERSRQAMAAFTAGVYDRRTVLAVQQILDATYQAGYSGAMLWAATLIDDHSSGYAAFDSILAGWASLHASDLYV